MVEQATKQRLIETAMELFHEQGYSATGIAQILKKAGAKSGSLYYFFPTKEDLLRAVLETYKEILWPVLLQPIFDRVSDPIERIFALLDGYRQFLIASGCKYGCPIGILALEVGELLPLIRELIDQNFAGWIAAVQKCLDDAGDRFPPELDRKQLASFVLTVMEGGVMQARAAHAIEPFEFAVACLRDYFERILADGTSWSQPSSAAHADPDANGPSFKNRISDLGDE